MWGWAEAPDIWDEDGDWNGPDSSQCGNCGASYTPPHQVLTRPTDRQIAEAAKEILEEHEEMAAKKRRVARGKLVWLLAEEIEGYLEAREEWCRNPDGESAEEFEARMYDAHTWEGDEFSVRFDQKLGWSAIGTVPGVWDGDYFELIEITEADFAERLRKRAAAGRKHWPEVAAYLAERNGGSPDDQPRT